MIEFSALEITGISAHQVGNKLKDEKLELSDQGISMSDSDTKNHLLSYFLSPFESNEIYNFSHASNIELNEVYSYVKKIFTNPDSLHQCSIDISKHLFEKSTHPKVEGGEFFVCLFENCILDGETSNAVGLFKSEMKDVFLTFNTEKGDFGIKHESGVNIEKLDKGCLIFNMEAENGYKVCVIDNKSKSTQFWKNDFLNITPAADNYHSTKRFLSMTKEYVTKQVPNDLDLNSADKIDLLNRSVDYFKSNDAFDKNDFERNVLGDEKLIKSFEEFGEKYNADSKGKPPKNFEISSTALKKQERYFKKVLKLDKNFHIYIHGDRHLIEQGTESNGKKYYKIYYDNEK